MKCLEIIMLMLLLRTPMYRTQDTQSVFIVTKDHCITNSSSAIAFNTRIEDINERADTLSHFYPNQQREGTCNIEYGEECTRENTFGKWSLIDSIDGEINDEVLDRRWEELRTYKSKHYEQDGDTYSFERVDLQITKSNFVIPFSVRLKYEGHIFLCENEVSNSKCYWIMLEAYDGATSAIRRCGAGSIPQKTEDKPTGSCKPFTTNFNHTEDDIVISESSWTHFKIIMNEGTISVKRSDENSQLLGFKDNKPFSPRWIFVHSKRSLGVWKFHKYTYLQITTEDGPAALGAPLDFKESRIALFIAMCATCVLRVQMVDSSGTEIYTRHYTTWDEKWKEIKIHLQSNTTEKYIMYVTTSFRQKRASKPFWAIDSVRHCKDNEYRVLESSNNNAPCQLIENKNSIITTETTAINDQNVNCSETTFGRTCVPCATIGNSYCPSRKYCELFKNKKSCHCTAGFQSDSCDKPCPQGLYGHGCKKQCNCRNGCNNINGVCNAGGCIEGFKGLTCDEPVAPLLKYAPAVIDIHETSCNVYIPYYDVIGDRTSVNYLRIQFKKNVDKTWANLEETSFTDVQYIQKISNLDADTGYCVRAQLYSNRSYVYQGSAIREMCFNTTCIQYNINDIRIFTSNISATVELQQNEYTCQINNYKYSLDAGKEQDMKETVQLLNLKPSQNYVFNLRHSSGRKISKVFQTEGASLPLINMTMTWTGNNDLNIFWKHPNVSNEIVKKFAISIKSDESQTFSKEITFEGDYNLTYSIEEKHFKPCRKYDVNVTIYTEKDSRKLNVIQKWSPPPVPDISEDAVKISHTTNIIIIYIPKPTNIKQDLENCTRKLHILDSLWQNNEQVDKDINDFERAIQNSLELPGFYNIRRLFEINQEDLPFKFPMKDDSVTKYRLHLFFVNECFGNVRIKKIQRDLLPGTPLKKDNLEGISTGWHVFFISALILPLIPYVFLFALIWKYEVKDNLSKKCKQQANIVEEIPMSDINEPQPSTSTAQPRY